MKLKYCKETPRKTLVISLAVLLFIVALLVAAIVILIILLTQNAKRMNDETSAVVNGTPSQSWFNRTRARNCARLEYLQPHPPLVIIALNGVVRSLAELSFPTLVKIGGYGAMTEAVYPGFQASNLTNKVAMATGLYPQSQEFDFLTSNNGLNITREDVPKPIWLAYQQQTDGVTALHSWPLNPFEAHLPDYHVPSNHSVTLEEQLNTVVEWLKMDSFSRPGLIMVSCEEIKRALQSNLEETVVNKMLKRFNAALDAFFTKLYNESVLDCVNLVIVSDEGISNGTRCIDAQSDSSEEFTSDPGTVTLVNNKNTDSIASTSSLPCKSGKDRRIFSVLTLPTRWHYGGTNNSANTVIFERRSAENFWYYRDEQNLNNYGLDYIDKDMHTIFYAQGPSFRSGSVLPPFQNVEFMNLWLDLLNMHYVPNNGTVGFMDEIMNKPTTRERNRHFGIRECSYTQEENVINCAGCTALQQVRIANWMSNCIQPNRPLVLLSSSSYSPCYQKICEKLIIKGNSPDDSMALLELFHANNTVAKSQSYCRFVSSRYEIECPVAEMVPGYESRSLSAHPQKVLARIATIQVLWKNGFIRDVLDPLNEYTLAISKDLARIISITGTAYDRNLDGIADQDKSGSPTHLYRVLIACSNGWSVDGFTCRNPWGVRVLSFIFPHMDGDVNCLSPRELLLLYTARLKDVELISGLEIDVPGVPSSHALHLRLNIPDRLW